VDFRTLALTHGSSRVDLSQREIRLLQYFVENRGKTISRTATAASCLGISPDAVNTHRRRSRAEASRRRSKRIRGNPIHHHRAGVRLSVRWIANPIRKRLSMMRPASGLRATSR
jgi:DNA-binding response OmpR family regulator